MNFSKNLTFYAGVLVLLLVSYGCASLYGDHIAESLSPYAGMNERGLTNALGPPHEVIDRGEQEILVWEYTSSESRQSYVPSSGQIGTPNYRPGYWQDAGTHDMECRVSAVVEDGVIQQVDADGHIGLCNEIAERL